jgi:hypothetical protein
MARRLCNSAAATPSRWQNAPLRQAGEAWLWPSASLEARQAPRRSREQIKHLVHAKPDYGVWLVVKGPEEDEPIGDHQHVELHKHPHARFITGPKKSTEGSPTHFLPECDREYLTDKDIAFEEIVDGGQRGVVLRQHLLPAGLFDAPKADLLILVPAGYPDVPPDNPR